MHRILVINSKYLASTHIHLFLPSFHEIILTEYKQYARRAKCYGLRNKTPVTDEKTHSNQQFICHKVIDPGCLVRGRLSVGA